MQRPTQEKQVTLGQDTELHMGLQPVLFFFSITHINV